MEITFCGEYIEYDNKVAVKWNKGNYKLSIEGSDGKPSYEISVDTIWSNDKLKLEGDLKGEGAVCELRYHEENMKNDKGIYLGKIVFDKDGKCTSRTIPAMGYKVVYDGNFWYLVDFKNGNKTGDVKGYISYTNEDNQKNALRGSWPVPKHFAESLSITFDDENENYTGPLDFYVGAPDNDKPGTLFNNKISENGYYGTLIFGEESVEVKHRDYNKDQVYDTFKLTEELRETFLEEAGNSNVKEWRNSTSINDICDDIMGLSSKDEETKNKKMTLFKQTLGENLKEDGNSYCLSNAGEEFLKKKLKVNGVPKEYEREALCLVYLYIFNRSPNPDNPNAPKDPDAPEVLIFNRLSYGGAWCSVPDYTNLIGAFFDPWGRSPVSYVFLYKMAKDKLVKLYDKDGNLKGGVCKIKGKRGVDFGTITFKGNGEVDKVDLKEPAVDDEGKFYDLVKKILGDDKFCEAVRNKGSVRAIARSTEWPINKILKDRGLYPEESFDYKKFVEVIEEHFKNPKSEAVINEQKNDVKESAPEAVKAPPRNNANQTAQAAAQSSTSTPPASAPISKSNQPAPPSQPPILTQDEMTERLKKVAARYNEFRDIHNEFLNRPDIEAKKEELKEGLNLTDSWWKSASKYQVEKSYESAEELRNAWKGLVDTLFKFVPENKQDAISEKKEEADAKEELDSTKTYDALAKRILKYMQGVQARLNTRAKKIRTGFFSKFTKSKKFKESEKKLEEDLNYEVNEDGTIKEEEKVLKEPKKGGSEIYKAFFNAGKALVSGGKISEDNEFDSMTLYDKLRSVKKFKGALLDAFANIGNLDEWCGNNGLTEDKKPELTGDEKAKFNTNQYKKKQRHVELGILFISMAYLPGGSESILDACNGLKQAGLRNGGDDFVKNGAATRKFIKKEALQGTTGRELVKKLKTSSDSNNKIDYFIKKDKIEVVSNKFGKLAKMSRKITSIKGKAKESYVGKKLRSAKNTVSKKFTKIFGSGEN